MAFHVIRVSIIVNASLVAKDPLLVEEKDVRSADRSILSGNLLSLIAKVWKVEAFFLRSCYHVFKTVLRVSMIIVAIDRHQSGAFGQIVPLQLNHSRLIRLHVGTMITAEDYCYGLLVRETLERIRLAVNALQLEVYRCASNGKPN